MNNQKTNTKIKNALLTIIGIPMAIIMVSEVQEPSCWWMPIIAGLGVLVIIKIALGGKQNEWNKSWGN